MKLTTAQRIRVWSEYAVCPGTALSLSLYIYIYLVLPACRLATYSYSRSFVLRAESNYLVPRFSSRPPLSLGTRLHTPGVLWVPRAICL